MSALSVLQAGAARGARATGVVVAAGILAGLPWCAGSASAKQPDVSASGITLRLPDGRSLHFVSPPVSGRPSHSRPPHSAPPHSTPPHSGPTHSSPGPTPPSGSPSGSSSASPSGSTSGLPVPVVSSLFPAPSASGVSRRPGSPASEDPERPRASHRHSVGRPTPVRPTQPAGDAVPAQDGQAVPQPGPPQPDRPQTSVPPPLGPQAILPAEGGVKTRVAGAAQRSGVLGPRGRLLGVGLALIGSGAALFGWRIRRL